MPVVIRLFNNCQPVIGKYIEVKPIDNIILRMGDVAVRIPLCISRISQPSQCQYCKVAKVHLAVIVEVAGLSTRAEDVRRAGGGAVVVVHGYPDDGGVAPDCHGVAEVVIPFAVSEASSLASSQWARAGVRPALACSASKNIAIGSQMFRVFLLVILHSFSASVSTRHRE